MHRILALFLVATPASAQIPSASAAALGMGDNYTAAARGFNAVAWNPSALALTGTPVVSLTILTLRGANGLEPVTLGDLADYSNRVVPDAVRRDWLSRIVADGRQHGEGEVAGTWLAAQYGRFALHAGTRVRAETDVAPGVAELVMFGNGEGVAEVRDIDLSGSTLRARAWSSVGGSYAVPLDVGAARIAFGATVTFTMGHLLASGENSTGRSMSDPVALHLDFPVVQTSLDDFRVNAGTGVGLDLGASVEAGDLTVSAVVHNVASTFAWDVDLLEYRALSMAIDDADATTTTEAVPFATAPAALRDRIRALGFERSLALGGAWRPDPRVLLSADARFSPEDGMLARPARHIGAGTEVRLASWLPMRVGAAWISPAPGDTGWQASAGFGMEAGPWGVNAAVARRISERLGGVTVFMLSLTSVGTN